MSLFLTILLSVLVLAFIVFAVIMFLPKGNPKDINIHLDDNSKIKVSRSEEGIRVDVIYDDYRTRPSDAELFPDIVSQEKPLETGLSRDFWLKVASLDILSDNDRTYVSNLLVKNGYISEDKLATMLQPDTESSVQPQTQDECPDIDEDEKHVQDQDVDPGMPANISDDPFDIMESLNNF